jgi:hypothetical protein
MPNDIKKYFEFSKIRNMRNDIDHIVGDREKILGRRREASK